jgi:putative phosphoesterase
LTRVRLAILADTHLPRGSRVIPPGALERAAASDAILHAGDFNTLDVLEHLRALGPPVYAVTGNNDGPELRAVLPETRIDEFAGARIGMVHIPGPTQNRVDRLRGAFPDADAVVFGHTHMPEHEIRGPFQIFNPGSPTERRRAPGHTMGIATVTDGRIAFELVHLA